MCVCARGNDVYIALTIHIDSPNDMFGMFPKLRLIWIDGECLGHFFDFH